MEDREFGQSSPCTSVGNSDRVSVKSDFDPGSDNVGVGLFASVLAETGGSCLLVCGRGIAIWC